MLTWLLAAGRWINAVNTVRLVVLRAAQNPMKVSLLEKDLWNDEIMGD